MLRQKSNSVCFPSNTKSNKHCVDDLACFHCCKCWITHKKQCQIKAKTHRANLIKIQNENKLLKQSIEKLVRQLLNLKSQKKQRQNIDDLKDSIKADLMKQIEQQSKMKILIQDQKIVSLNESLQFQKQQNQKLNGKLKRQLIQMGEYSLKNRQLQDQIKVLQQKVKLVQKHIQRIQKLEDHIKKIQNKQNIYKEDINRKDQLINRLQIQMKQSQKIINTKTSLQSQYEFQQKKLSLNLKEKESVIQGLTIKAESQMKGLSLLEFENNRLNSLMLQLDNQLLQKQVQSNCLKRSLYDAQNIAWHKQTKLEMLKSDILQLKYRM